MTIYGLRSYINMGFYAVLLLIMPVTSYAVEYPEEQEVAEQVVYQDEATQTIQAMAESEKPATTTNSSADDLATSYIESQGLFEGWNDDKKMYVAIGQAFFDSEDPSYDDSFVIKRSLKSMEATLEAKANIINFIRTSMSAMDKAVTPGTDVNAKFQQEMDTAQKRMEAQKLQIAKLLEQVDASEAEALRGATFGDRLNALLDAAIAKLDGKYNAEGVELKKKEKYEKAKARYEESLVQYNDLEKKLNAFAGTIKEKISSKVETLSAMPLFGATPVAQFESWNEDREQYCVTMVVVWSSKMERVARTMITGEAFPVPPGNLSLRDWIKQENWATATGGRRFRDNTGNVYFIGIAASPVGGSSSSEKQAKGVAELNAQKEVAMAIFSDVSSHKKAEQIMQTRSGGSGKDTSAAVESFSSELQQEIKDRQIQGMQKFYGKKLIHPISNQEIYVAIYGVSANSAKQALLMEERNYLTRILDVKNQQKMKGTADAYTTKVHQTQADQSEYIKAKQEKSQSIDGSTAKSTFSKTNAKSPEPISTSSAQQSAGGTARSGSFSGGGKGDLSW